MSIASKSDLEVTLDLSRLFSRVRHPTPTGVDRVEMAYARGLLARIPQNLRFSAVHPCGVHGLVPRQFALRFLDAVEEQWEHGEGTSKSIRFYIAQLFLGLRPHRFKAGARSRRIYLQASPNNLTRPKLIRRILKKENARFVCFVHDLIPTEFPEYARPSGSALHRARIATIAEFAQGVIANSHATMLSLQPWLKEHGNAPYAAVAHLGTHVSRNPSPIRCEKRPFFLCIGTIEPRKNHLLLLHLWRKMAEERGPKNIPKLILIGRRGWENEQVVDMLERCSTLSDCVEERGRLRDAEVATLLRGSSGVLLPSFAEGYGMPVTEALNFGVPVVCSDLPALRESGGDVPHFLDPLDGPAWRRAIEDLASSNSLIRARQQQALAGWQSPSWVDHISILLDLLEKVAG